MTDPDIKLLTYQPTPQSKRKALDAEWCAWRDGLHRRMFEEWFTPERRAMFERDAASSDHRYRQ
jgi:hypothetical protein